MKPRTFITLGYYIIRSKQRTLSENKYQDTEEDKRRLFEDLFLQNETTYTSNKSEFVLADVEHHNNYYYGKFAKRLKQILSKKEGCHIHDTSLTGYPYSYFVCDTDKNIFCIERSSKIYKTPENIIKILSDMVTEKIKNEGYVCIFQAVTQKRAFWHTIKDAKKIYYLRLTLNSPNFLRSNEKARDFAKSLQDKFNNTTTDVVLRNDEGNLKIEENETTNDYIEYAEEAGGKWAVKFDGTQVKSSDKIFSFQRTVTNIKDAAEDIISQANSFLHR